MELIYVTCWGSIFSVLKEIFKIDAAVLGTVSKPFSEYNETKLNSGIKVSYNIDMEVLAGYHGQYVQDPGSTVPGITTVVAGVAGPIRLRNCCSQVSSASIPQYGKLLLLLCAAVIP